MFVENAKSLVVSAVELLEPEAGLERQLELVSDLGVVIEVAERVARDDAGESPSLNQRRGAGARWAMMSLSAIIAEARAGRGDEARAAWGEWLRAARSYNTNERVSGGC